MQLIKINNPFQRYLREVESLEFTGQSVEDLLRMHLQCIKEKQGFDLSLEYAKENIRISINGLIIPSEFWDTTKPQQNDQIVFMPIVGKGNSEKQILNIVIMITVMYFTGGAIAATGWGAGATAGSLSLAGSLALAGVMVGTGILINTLTPAPQAKSPNMEDWDSSQAYGWNPQTTQKQGITVPKFYGKNKLYGNVIAVHTEVGLEDNTKQTLKSLISLGSGPVNGIAFEESDSIDDITLSGTDPVSVEMTGHGFFDGECIKLKDVSGITPSLNDMYNITRTDANNYTLNGTDSSDYSGTFSSGIAGRPDIKINDQSISNYTNILCQEKRGLLNQSAISFFGETKPEYRPNVLVSHPNFRIYTTPDNDFDDLEIQLLFGRGLYYANNQGGISTHSVGIKIELSEAGVGSYSTLVEETITDDVTSSVRKCYVASGTYTGGSPVTITNGKQYDIRVSKTTENQSSSRYGDRVRLESVREVINDDFTYPKRVILGISALATDQISGGLSVSCGHECSVVTVYNGSTWNIIYNNNPAWVLWDILTQPVINGDGGETPHSVERYDGIDPSRLDLDKFYELAQFCDEMVPDGEGSTEKRITFNGGFDIGTTRWEAALKVCEIARCTLVWNGIELTLAIDKPSDPVQMFTVSNIIKDTFKETFLPQSELASEIEIHYRDEKQDYKRVPFTILEPDITNATSKVTLELFGITKQSEAWRAGMYRLAQNKYLKSTVEFDVDIDAIACTLGDVIYVQHDVPQWGAGGRVVSGTTLSIVVDQDLEYESDLTYEVLVRKADDTINKRTATSCYNTITGVNQGSKQFEISGNYANEYLQGDRIKIVDSTGNDGIYTLATGAVHDTGTTTITVNETILDNTVDGGLYNLRRVVVSSVFKNASDDAETPDEHDVYTFGVENLQARKYRIIGLRKTSDQIVTLTAIEYNPNIYSVDNGTPAIPIGGYSPPSSDPNSFQPPSWDDINNQFPSSVLGMLNIDIPITTNILWNNNTPTSGKVSWSKDDGTNPILFTYKGITYEITASNTDKKYIYWDCTYTTSFQSSDNIADAIGTDKWLMCINESGTTYPAFGRKVIHGGIIKAGTLLVDTADIIDAAIKTAKIDDLQVETIKIKNNAVSEEASAFTLGSTSADIIQSVSITTLGNPVLIIACCACSQTTSGGGTPYSVTHKLKRDSTTLITLRKNYTWISENCIMVVDTPPQGTYTYKYEYTFTASAPITKSATNRSLVVRELKK